MAALFSRIIPTVPLVPVFLCAGIFGILPYLAHAHTSIILELPETDHHYPLESPEEYYSVTYSQNQYPKALTQASEWHQPISCSLFSLCTILASSRLRIFPDYIETITPNEEAIAVLVNRVANAVNDLPQITNVIVENNALKSYNVNTDLWKLDTAYAREHIASTVLKYAKTSNVAKDTNFVIPLKRQRWNIDTTELGLTDLLSIGQTNFAGSSKDRLHNIQTALEKFSGITIASGGELSFVEILGPVEEETGYKSELVIRNNKTEPEYGGGICQVSTTLFRAAVEAGLKVTARRNHSYPVHYYKPYGYDATIYVPSPDLKFQNNTGGYITFIPQIEGTQLSFMIFGTGDGRDVAIEGPKAVKKKHPDEFLRTELVQKVFSKAGSLLFEDTFISSYDDPAKYPKPEPTLTEKPDNWSVRQWKEYQDETQ